MKESLQMNSTLAKEIYVHSGDKNMNDWTIMVYMAGDNNLSENMAYALEDLRKFSETLGNSKENKMNLLSYFDSNSLTAPTYFIDYSAGKIKKRAFGAGNSQNENPEGNSSSATSIVDFVRWCIIEQKRTAQNYAIIFSGHSFGFHGTSFLRDETSGGFITISDFRWALEQCTKKYLKKEIAILGFDSCVMSMLEIGFELKDVAQTMVASEGSLPNSGWSYAPLLGKIATEINKKIKKNVANKYFKSGEYVKDVAKSFVSTYIEEHTKLVIGGRSVDISAWDLDKVKPLGKAVNRLGAELNKLLYLVDKVQNETLTNEDIWTFSELKKIILQSHYDSQTYMHEQCVDIEDFCKRLLIELKLIEGDKKSAVFKDLKKLCKKIISLVDKCVIKSGFSGDEYQFSNGISLYFPWSYLTFDLTDQKYRNLLYNRGKKTRKDGELNGIGKDWYRFLSNYLTRVTMRLARKRNYESGEAVSSLELLNKDNPIWSKTNPIWTKENAFWEKSNPIASRSNPTASRSNPTASRSNPTASRGEMGDYLFYFSRFKNYELRWDISGFADEFEFDEKFED